MRLLCNASAIAVIPRIKPHLTRSTFVRITSPSIERQRTARRFSRPVLERGGGEDGRCPPRRGCRRRSMAAASQSASNGRRAKRERRGGLLGLLRGPKLFSARRAGDHDTLDASDHDAQDRKHVDMTGWHLDLEVGMLRGRSYRRQRIVLTGRCVRVCVFACARIQELLLGRQAHECRVPRDAATTAA